MHTTRTAVEKMVTDVVMFLGIDLVCSCKQIKEAIMPNDKEINEMIASYTPEEAELMRDLLEEDEDEELERHC